MHTRRQKIRTEVRISLLHAFPHEGPALIFDAYVQDLGNDEQRWTLSSDIHGVLDAVTSLGLVTEPETFGSDEERYSFWKEVLARVELEHDHAELTQGTHARLSYPDVDGELVGICEWDTPKRFAMQAVRTWVPESASA